MTPNASGSSPSTSTPPDGPNWARHVKQLNSALHHNSLANRAHISPDIHLGHHGLGTVIHNN